MAQVTIELRTLLEKTNFKLFDFDYQFDDQTFKAQLEKDVTEFYYDYEIGQETPDMFKRKFKANWNRIIPYYNKLYNTTLLAYNPLSNYKVEEVLDQLAATVNTQATDMALSSTGKNTTGGTTTIAQDLLNNNTRTSTQTNDLTTTTDGTSSNTNTQTNNLTETQNGSTTSDLNRTDSDYPQQPIAGGDYASGASKETNTETTDNTTTNTGTVKNDGNGTNHNTSTNTGTVTSELTEALDQRTDNTTTIENEVNTTDNTTNKGTVTNNGTVNTDYTKTIEGITGITYPELIEKHRGAILRINDMIIEEMKKCFILVY